MDWDWPNFVFVEVESLASNWATEFLVAVAGVLLGGIITFSISYYFKYIENKRRIQAERTKKVSKFFVLYYEIIDLFNDVLSIKSSYHQVFSDGKRPVQPIDYMQPLFGHYRPAKFFTGDDFLGLSDIITADIVNELGNLCRLRNTIVSLVDDYSSKKHNLTKLMLQHGGKRGARKTIVGDFDTDNNSELILEREWLEDYAKELVKALDEFHHDSIAFSKKYNECIQKSNDKSINTKILDFENTKSSELL